MNAPDRRIGKWFTLSTPEAVDLVFPLAEVTSRIVAFSLDLFLILVVTLFLIIVFLFATIFTGLASPLGIALIGIFLLRQFYFTFFEIVWHGSTPGKRLLGIRVVSRDGSGLTVDAVVTRNLLRDLELFLPMVLLLAPEAIFGDVPWWSWMPAIVWVLVFGALPLLTKERLRAGDVVAGTVVVRIPKAILFADEAARASAPPIYAPGNALGSGIRFTDQQLAIYGENELETLADLIRKIDAGKTTASGLAHIARTIAKKIGYEGHAPSHDPTRFLQSFYKQQRAALEKQLLYGKRKASKFDRSK